MVDAGIKTAVKQNKCPVCSDASPQVLLSVEDFPYFTVPVTISAKQGISRTLSSSQRSAPLKVRVCRNCHHCYLEDIPDNGILDDLYTHYYSYPSALKGHFHPSRDSRFLSFFDEFFSLCVEKKPKTVFEVGCYDGYVLYHLQERGFHVTGCDPSDGADIGIQYGVNVLKQFFHAASFLEKKLTYDVIISRHFIEHVSDPIKWMGDLASLMNPEGLLMLETPNVSFYLQKGLLEIFSLQHLQGFSASSLAYALREAGLRPLKLDETPDNLIVAAVKDSPEKDVREDTWDAMVDDFDRKFQTNRKTIGDIVTFYVQDNKKICLWGAGGFGFAAIMFYGIPAEAILFIIDSDPEKWGMEYLNYNLPIISPEEARQQEPHLIIITSMYSSDIDRQINAMNFQCSVLTLFPDISFKESLPEKSSGK